MAQVREGWPRRPAPAPLPPLEEGVSWGSTPAQRSPRPPPAPPRASPLRPASSLAPPCAAMAVVGLTDSFFAFGDGGGAGASFDKL